MRTPEVLGLNRRMDGQRARRQFVISDPTALEAVSRADKPHLISGGKSPTIVSTIPRGNEVAQTAEWSDATFLQEFFVDPRKNNPEVTRTSASEKPKHHKKSLLRYETRINVRRKQLASLNNALRQLNLSHEQGILSSDSYEQKRDPLIAQKKLEIRKQILMRKALREFKKKQTKNAEIAHMQDELRSLNERKRRRELTEIEYREQRMPFLEELDILEGRPKRKRNPSLVVVTTTPSFSDDDYQTIFDIEDHISHLGQAARVGLLSKAEFASHRRELIEKKRAIEQKGKAA